MQTHVCGESNWKYQDVKQKFAEQLWNLTVLWNFEEMAIKAEKCMKTNVGGLLTKCVCIFWLLSKEDHFPSCNETTYLD